MRHSKINDQTKPAGLPFTVFTGNAVKLSRSRHGFFGLSCAHWDWEFLAGIDCCTVSYLCFVRVALT